MKIGLSITNWTQFPHTISIRTKYYLILETKVQGKSARLLILKRWNYFSSRFAAQ